MHKKILPFLFLPLALGFATQVTAPEMPLLGQADYSIPAPEILCEVESFDAFLEEAILHGAAPGAAVAIVANGKVLLSKGYGLQSIQHAEPVDAHTIFRIASLSKSFAAFLTGRLVEKEVLKWEDPVIQYLPDLCLLTDKQTETLQLVHLLSQTTGLPYHTYTNLIELGRTTEEIMPLLADVELIGDPGTVYSYQNSVFSLIGEVVKVATGLEYEENLQREVFGPLHMTDASASLDGFLHHPNAAMPHQASRAGSWRQLAPSPHYYNAAPAGGVNASATDMAHYLLAMLGNRPDILSAETLKKLGTPYIFSPIRWRYFHHWDHMKKAYYGLGWRVLDLGNEETLLYHGGYVAGYRAEIAVHPRDGWGICVMFNGAAGMADQCIPKFLELMEKKKEVL
ncbi:MAG: beta-lactamase family protein [Saprospirales bacterium]|nr:beta-lactamase family protein [Saprospirales bacterium]